MDLAERTPELLFRLRFGDSSAAAQLSLIAESKPLVLQMLRSRNPIISGLAPIITAINTKAKAWISRIAIHGGMAPDKKPSDNKEKAITEYARQLIQKFMANRKTVEEGIRKDVDSNLISKDELREVIRSLPSEEIERIKKALERLTVEASNKNIAAYHFHETEVQTSWLVSTAYGILTRNEVKAALPSEKTARAVKTAIEKSIREKTPVHLIGFWGGYKKSDSGRADLADKLALDKIKETVDKLKSIGIDATVTMLFADVHASNPMIGRTKDFGERKVFEYMNDIVALCEKNGFEITCLSRLYGAVSLLYNRPESKKYKFKKWTSDDIGEGVSKAHSFMETEEAKEVIEAATKYADVDTSTPAKARQVALDYAATRFYESKALDRSFPDSIFFAYSWPIEALHPKKTLFWHSVGRLSNPPWYMEMKEERKDDKPKA